MLAGIGSQGCGCGAGSGWRQAFRRIAQMRKLGSPLAHYRICNRLYTKGKSVNIQKTIYSVYCHYIHELGCAEDFQT